METLDLLVLFFYLIIILGIGGFFFKRNQSSNAFILGNQTIPSWVVSLSFFATFVSSISYLALPGSAFQGNWSAFTFSLSIPIAAIMAVKIFVPLYRRVQSPSAYTYLEQRFGSWARVYAASMYLLTQIMRVGTILYLMAITLNAVFEWELGLIILLTGFVVAIYSMVGGIQAVVWTDAMQALVLISGALICLIYLFTSMPEGSLQLIDIAQENNKFSLGSFEGGLGEATFWVILVYGVFINLQNYGIDQNYVQRYMLTKNEGEAKRSAFWGGMLYIPVSLLFLFIGSALFAFYDSGAISLPPELQQPGKGDLIFPYFIVHQLPSGLTGLLIASILAAGMSTISTSYNSVATVILNDFVSKLSGSELSEKQKMRVLYLSTIAISLLGIAVAVAMINVKSALDAWWKLASVFSGGMLGLFLLGVFSRLKNAKGAIIATIFGVCVIMVMTLSDVLEIGLNGIQIHAYLTIVIGTLTIFLIGFGIGLITENKAASNP